MTPLISMCILVLRERTALFTPGLVSYMGACDAFLSEWHPIIILAYTDCTKAWRPAVTGICEVAGANQTFQWICKA